MVETETFFFVDKARGIYAAWTGALYICRPHTFDLLGCPMALPTPYRVVTQDSLDPFIVIFTGVGHIHVCNTMTNSITLRIPVPGVPAVIQQVSVRNDGRNLILATTRGVYYYEDGWTVLSEPIESLLVKADQKVFAQCACFENDILSAAKLDDFEEFQNGSSLYLRYMATYAPIQAFVGGWYSIIGGSFPFDRARLLELWRAILDELAAIDRIANLIDELKLSLSNL
jgi:hypothetical protein